MKKAIVIGLAVLCVGVFAFGDILTASNAPNVQGKQVNGVARINKSCDIIGSVKLTDCPVDADPTLPTFSVLVYVAGESIMARPIYNVIMGTYDFVLYNVPVPRDDFTVDVTAEVAVVGAASLVRNTVPVLVGKHLAVTMEAPIEISCPGDTQE